MIAAFIRLGKFGVAILTFAVLLLSSAGAKRRSPSRLVEINVASRPSSLDEQGSPRGPLASDETEQDEPIQGPILGYIYDRAAARIRCVVGIAGSSYVGDGLDPGLALSDFYYLPMSQRALALAESRGSLEVLRISSNNVFVEAAVDVHWPISRLAVSPRGSSAALYCNRTRTIQVVTGIASDPRVIAQIDVSDLPPDLTALAVSDDGKALLFGIEESGVGLVCVSSFQQNDYEPDDRVGRRRVGAWCTEVVAVCGEVSEVAFLRNSKNALVADRTHHKVFQLQQTPAGFVQLIVASLEDGVCGPAALAVSDDGNRVFVANSGTSSILVMDIRERFFHVLPCETPPTKLIRMNGRSVYQLTDISAGPLLVLDAGEAQPNVYFVPFRRNRETSVGGVER